MATTTTKKEILDYLWEWTDNIGKWSKVLVQTVVKKETTLTDDERNAVYNEFIGSIIPQETETSEPVEKPHLILEQSDLQLCSMSEIKGVNRLAENQLLNFSKNLTVIYGENASGKSGYCRILKALGFSYEKESNVLCNVYDSEKTSQNAKISYVVDGKETQFTWDGVCNSPDLQAISVFNNNCVSLSLDSRRELLVTPFGFHLFSLVSGELDKLAMLHREKIDQLTKSINWLDDLHKGTPVFDFLKDINDKSSKDDLNKLGNYTDKDREDLEQLKKAERNLNKSLLNAQIESLKNEFKELNKLNIQIKSNKDSFLPSDWNKMIDHLTIFERLKKKEQKGLKEIADERGIKFYESVEFSNLIKAADEYIKKLGKKEYPKDEDEICVYCRQKLIDKDSQELLRCYRLLLNDPTQAEIRKHTNDYTILQNRLNGINTDIVMHYPSFGKDNEGNPTQPDFLIKFCADIKRFQKVAKTKEIEKFQDKPFDIDYLKIIKILDEKLVAITNKLNEKNQTLSKIEEKEIEIEQNINEIKDRKKLNQKLLEVENIIDGLKLAKFLKGYTRIFSTDSISRMTSKARNDLIAENFSDIFAQELKGLRKSDIKVNLNFRTDKAVPHIVQDIGSDYSLSDILSEGEQKAIALAEFLTELQLDKSKAAVVFDDPVTSLDHKIIDEVGRRLVALSKERQVIVFTHSIILLNSIKHMSELPRFKSLEFKYYETETDFINTGILNETPILREETFKNYKTKINKILNLPSEERTRKEGELAVDGYGKMRAGIEILVEKEIFKETVKRYRKNVALTSLEKVNGALIDKHKEHLYDIFEKCCEFIEAHSSPDELPPQPTLNELKIDFEDLCKIRNEFIN